jgi:hypothetical protein
LLEIPQIGRRLIFLCGHQESIRAQVIVFLADDDMDVALDAIKLAPVWARVRIACSLNRLQSRANLGSRPWSRRMSIAG